MDKSSIQIPCPDGFVEVFPDELPIDVNDIIECLQGEFAPLKVEYYRQGMHDEFNSILNVIVKALKEKGLEYLLIYDSSKIFKDVEKHYSDKGEDILGIYDTIASFHTTNALSIYGKVEGVNDEIVQAVDFIKQTEQINKLNGYTWLIKGFVEITKGMMDEAETYFKHMHDTSVRTEDASKKIFLYGSLLGLGVVAFSRSKFSISLDYFSRALNLNSKVTTPNVRLAIAACCFKLGYYDRCRAATERALHLDPSNADTYMMLSLIEHAEAKKVDKVSRRHKYLRSLEYSTMAHHVDPMHALALNHLANYYFCNWKVLDTGACSTFVSPTSIEVKFLKHTDLALYRLVSSLESESILQIQRSKRAVIAHVELTHADREQSEHQLQADHDGAVEEHKSSATVTEVTCTITLQAEFPQYQQYNEENELHHRKNFFLEVMDCKRVRDYATQAFHHARVPQVKSESAYILGRLCHMLGDVDTALQLYDLSNKLWSENPLALFGLGQLYLSKQNYQQALEYFESVLKSYPDDKDTQAYLALIKSLSRKEIVPIEKLRELTASFAFEIDLWVAQGQIRHMKGPSEYKGALKCYEMALSCYTSSQQHPSSNLMMDIAVIHYSLGSLSLARQFITDCLKLISAEVKILNPQVCSMCQPSIFRQPENDIFCDWSSDICTLSVDTCVGLKASCRIVDQSPILSGGFKQGMVLKFGDIVATVCEVVDPSTIVVYTLLNLRRYVGGEMTARLKIMGANFNSESTSHSFTYARILEDCGEVQAAMELYLEMLKIYPAYSECYLRLSVIACNMGRQEEAMGWIVRGLHVDGGHVDSMIVQAELYTKQGAFQEALKKYEKILHMRKKKDHRASIAIGNLLYANPFNDSVEHSLKNSLKIFHSVLSEDLRNVYATNGLAIMCMEKDRFDISRDMLARIRECDIPVFEDIWTNLAHTHMLLHRYNDASHLYQATLKALPKSLCVHRQVSSATHISDCLALAYFKSKQYEDSLRVILKAIHLAPHQLYIWQNLCFAKKHFAESLVKETATVQVLKDKPDKSEGKEAATQKSKDNAAEKPIRANVTSKELLQALSEMENVLRFCAYLKSAPDETTEVYRKDLCCNIPQYIQCDWVQFEAIKTFCDVCIKEYSASLSTVLETENKASEIRSSRQEDVRKREDARKQAELEMLKKEEEKRLERQQKALLKSRELEHIKIEGSGVFGDGGEKKEKKPKRSSKFASQEDVALPMDGESEVDYGSSDQEDNGSEHGEGGKDKDKDKKGHRAKKTTKKRSRLYDDERSEARSKGAESSNEEEGVYDSDEDVPVSSQSVAGVVGEGKGDVATDEDKEEYDAIFGDESDQDADGDESGNGNGRNVAHDNKVAPLNSAANGHSLKRPMRERDDADDEEVAFSDDESSPANMSTEADHPPPSKQRRVVVDDDEE